MKVKFTNLKRTLEVVPCWGGRSWQSLPPPLPSSKKKLLLVFYTKRQTRKLRLVGIEPTHSIWKTDILPLNDSRYLLFNNPLSPSALATQKFGIRDKPSDLSPPYRLASNFYYSLTGKAAKCGGGGDNSKPYFSNKTLCFAYTQKGLERLKLRYKYQLFSSMLTTQQPEYYSINIFIYLLFLYKM